MAAAGRASLDQGALTAQAAAACDRLLSERLADDPGVYVLRRVRLEMGAFVPSGDPGAALVGRLSRRMAGAVLREMARGGEEMVRFADQAEYVVGFTRDLLAGGAWGRWYYHPFARWRAGSVRETLRRVLAENRAHLPGILAGLGREGLLEAVLRLLGPEAVAELWDAGDDPAYDREALRPLAAAALELARQLDLWMAPSPSLAWLVEETAAARPVVDWRDPRSLAAAVLAAVAVLVRRDRLRPPAEAGPDALEAALRGLDWLDHVWLRERLLALVAVGGARRAGTAAAPLPTRTPGGPTARGRRLLEALRGLLDDPSFAHTLDRGAPASPGNGLRLYAALAERHPEWREDPLAHRLIQRVLAAWGALQGGQPAEMEQALRGLGEPGKALVGKLSGTAAAMAATPRLDWPNAGAALLLRTLLDTRLPARIARVAPDGALPALLAGLLLRLSPAPLGEELAQGLVAICGGCPSTLSELREALRPVPVAPLARAWLEALVDQRALAGGGLHLFRLPDEDGDGHRVLMGVDPSGFGWPLGRLVGDGGGAGKEPAVAEEWVEVWREVMGAPAASFSDNTTLAGQIDATPQRIDGDDPALSQAHRALGERLATTWGALAPGKLGLPAHDLLLGVMAAGLLRLWARWLRNFSGSSAPYLLEQFLHRPGTVFAGADEWRIALAPRPLDVVLEMAGYFDPLERVPWLGGRRLVFGTR
jgi:hypothetical protein